jgi:flagellar basal-body rod modification protein FlgD
MDWSNYNSIATTGNSAAGVVASAFTPRATKAQVKAQDSSTPTGGTTPSSSTPAADSSDITADDFLTLLVSELQNQDPTQPTDPNEYITQLAQVNSLQQLISINQGISTLDGAVPTSGSSPSSGSNSNAVAAVTSANVASAIPSAQSSIWGGVSGN